MNLTRLKEVLSYFPDDWELFAVGDELRLWPPKGKHDGWNYVVMVTDGSMYNGNPNKQGTLIFQIDQEGHMHFVRFGVEDES